MVQQPYRLRPPKVLKRALVRLLWRRCVQLLAVHVIPPVSPVNPLCALILHPHERLPMFVKRDLMKWGGADRCPLRRDGVLLAILLGMVSIAQAQQSNSADPDYSRVSDILRGRRTLLSINDLVLGGTLMKTSDGTKIEDKDISELH